MEWEWIEKSCTMEKQKRNLTFSTCDIKKHFTCDSGSCIYVIQRCDNIQNCLLISRALYQTYDNDEKVEKKVKIIRYASLILSYWRGKSSKIDQPK